MGVPEDLRDDECAWEGISEQTPHIIIRVNSGGLDSFREYISLMRGLQAFVNPHARNEAWGCGAHDFPITAIYLKTKSYRAYRTVTMFRTFY